MKEDLTNQEGFTIKDIIDIILKKWIIIMGFSIISGIVVSLITIFMITPQYSANAKYYAADSTSHSLGTNSSELMYLQKLVNTYIQLFKTEKFYDNVIVCSEVDLSTLELKQMITVSAEADTSIFNVTVSGTDVDTIMSIQNAIAEFAPEMVTDVTKSGRVVLCDPAKIPLKPCSPNQMRNTFAGIVAGFVISFFIALATEITNKKISNKKDIENRYELPVLAQIPSFTTHRNKKENSSNQNAFLCDINNVNKNAAFFVKEAYKMLRTNLRYTSNGNTCRKVIITSPSMQEGKTVTAVNLAVAIAEAGNRVLIIDGDMRDGQVHTYFRVRNSSGLSNLILGSAEISNTIIKYKGNQNLFIITSGTIDSDPLDMATSEEMTQLMNRLSEQFDYIIVDSPAINVVSDAIPFSKITDGIIMVVRCGSSTYSDIETAIDSFKLVDSNIIGFVLNDVLVSKKKYYRTSTSSACLQYNSYTDDSYNNENTYNSNTLKLKRQKQLK